VPTRALEDAEPALATLRTELDKLEREFVSAALAAPGGASRRPQTGRRQGRKS